MGTTPMTSTQFKNLLQGEAKDVGAETKHLTGHSGRRSLASVCVLRLRPELEREPPCLVLVFCAGAAERAPAEFMVC